MSSYTEKLAALRANNKAKEKSKAKYKIKSGDSLSKIAKQHGTTVAALMKANPSIKDKNKIKAGASINLGGGSKAKAAYGKDLARHKKATEAGMKKPTTKKRSYADRNKERLALVAKQRKTREAIQKRGPTDAQAKAAGNASAKAMREELKKVKRASGGKLSKDMKEDYTESPDFSKAKANVGKPKKKPVKRANGGQIKGWGKARRS